MFCLTCRCGIIHEDVVVLGGDGLLHEGLVEVHAVHLDVVVVLDQDVI